MTRTRMITAIFLVVASCCWFGRPAGTQPAPSPPAEQRGRLAFTVQLPLGEVATSPPTILIPTVHLGHPAIREPRLDAILERRTAVVLESGGAGVLVRQLAERRANEANTSISPGTEEQLVARLRCLPAINHLPIGRIRPFFLSLIAATECQDGNHGAQESPLPSLEARAIERARRNNITVIGLQSYTQRVEALSRIPDRFHIEEAERVLRESVNPLAWQARDQLLRSLIEALNAGDYDALYRFVLDRWAQSVHDETIIHRVMFEENHRVMSESLVLYILARQAVVFIGASHFGGPDNIIDTLRRHPINHITPLQIDPVWLPTE